MRTASRWLTIVLALTTSPLLAQPADTAVARHFDRREVMIPMRDGVRLFTVVLTPKRTTGQAPIIMSRTPYGTGGWGGTVDLLAAFKELIDDGYFFVFQDIRGQHQSEGQFVMNRPPRDRRAPKSIDEATDTWDTIEWLLANLPNSNRKVGMLGISYPGFLVNVALTEPHPALTAVSPQATMGDTWMGDDFFHQGAFRQSYGIEWVHGREARQAGTGPLRIGRWDTYDWYLSFPSLDSLARSVGANRWPTWQRFVAHPAYTAEWRSRAVQHNIRHAPIPTLTVGGWWDQEDGFGPLSTYAAMEPTDSLRRNYLIVGPWFHGQWYSGPADHLGDLKFGRDTGEDFRALQARWFRFWLKGQGDGRFDEATVFDAGLNQWKTFTAWPPADANTARLYLHPDGVAAFEKPGASAGGFDAFVSDPAKPVPYRPRPIPSYVDWEIWLSRDQRFVTDRPDVLSWQTAPLESDVAVAGNVLAKLFASTTGSDADWVVKLIDVYPDDVDDRTMRGYQLMVTSDILRGRYRRSFERAEPIPANLVLPYTVDLHQQSHTFRRGHRIMVQVQSTWFPLYDRNPQTFVANIFAARPADYRARTHRVYRSPRFPSHLELQIRP
jgi:putative CocE/NonD family hydrolase